MSENAVKYGYESSKMSRYVTNSQEKERSQGKCEVVYEGTFWEYLDGTVKESEQICSVFVSKNLKASKIHGPDACEDALMTLSGENSASVLHIATHGFFFRSLRRSMMNLQQEIRK
ncbi:MAG: CHAT domain-containing protein [Ignavibacteria bacterium]|nr:CHAT domain-containing protein [Ignavibacteria bacterium]